VRHPHARVPYDVRVAENLESKVRKIPLMPSLEIRSAGADDLTALTLLINQAFVAEAAYVRGERINADGVRDLLSCGTFLLGELDHTLVAGLYIERRGDSAHIGLVSVVPARQGQGLGTQIMLAAEAHCRAAGFRQMELRFINHRDELRRFYARLGYVATGVIESPDPSRMKVPFQFVQMAKPLLAVR
jgi:GNAT superfamily N-acetyltransferase